MANRIQLVGVELEGGWADPPEDVDIVRDISLQRLTSKHVGEIQSPPLALGPLSEWIKTHYPVEVNDTCGFHVHTSFKRNLDYSRLMSRAFYEHWLVELEKWVNAYGFPETHPIWPRIQGKNRFCNKIFKPEAQVNLKDKADDRRTLLNYPYSFHKTIECRLFPGFPKVQEAIDAMTKHVNVIEDYLSGLPKEVPTVVRIKLSRLGTLDEEPA